MPESSIGVMGSEQDVILARVGAYILDEILALILAAALGFGLGAATRSRGVIYLTVFGVFAGYWILSEGLWGQTPGKRLAGVVVVRRDGRPCTMGASLARNVLRIVDGIAHYAVGLVVMLVSDRRQRIGDHAAGTVVVRKR